MDKKVLIQALMILLIIIISWVFFSKYLKNNSNNKTEAQISEKEKLLEIKSSSYIDNVNYTSSDSRGNKYQIIAKRGEIDKNNKDIMFLEDVVSYILTKNSGNIKITSDFGKYNLINYDTIFSKNVIVIYPGHKITGEYLDFSLINNLGTMSTNVIYIGNEINMTADKIEMNISTKDTKIFMNNNTKKVLIEGDK